MSRESAEWELKHRVSHRRTICEVFREIWDIVDCIDNKDAKCDLKERIIDGYIMGKKMNNRLMEYKENWSEGQFDLNKEFQNKMQMRYTRSKYESEGK